MHNSFFTKTPEQVIFGTSPVNSPKSVAKYTDADVLHLPLASTCYSSNVDITYNPDMVNHQLDTYFAEYIDSYIANLSTGTITGLVTGNQLVIEHIPSASIETHNDQTEIDFNEPYYVDAFFTSSLNTVYSVMSENCHIDIINAEATQDNAKRSLKDIKEAIDNALMKKHKTYILVNLNNLNIRLPIIAKYVMSHSKICDDKSNHIYEILSMKSSPISRKHT